MGCFDANPENKNKPKQFHEMSEEEKEKIKIQKNKTKIQKMCQNPKTSYENFD